MKKIEQDWVKHPVIEFIAQIGGWGLYAAVSVLVVISVLELVDARNERVWWVALTTGQVAAIAWAGSWAVLLAAEAVNWIVRQARRN